jgi:hypothetical protein
MNSELTPRKRPLPPAIRDNVSAMYRGKYIQAVSRLEMILENAIAGYFCRGDFNREREFMFCVLATDKMSLNEKHEVFCFIAERHCPDVFKKHYKPFDKKEKRGRPNEIAFSNRVSRIFSTRNKFAHRHSFPLAEKPEDYEKIYFATLKAIGGVFKLDSLELTDIVMNDLLKEVRIVSDKLEIICEAILKVKKTRAVIPDPKS